MSLSFLFTGASCTSDASLAEHCMWLPTGESSSGSVVRCVCVFLSSSYIFAVRFPLVSDNPPSEHFEELEFEEDYEVTTSELRLDNENKPVLTNTVQRFVRRGPF